MELTDLDPHGIVLMMSREEINESADDRLTTKQIAEDNVSFAWKLSPLSLSATKLYLSCRFGKAGWTRVKYEADIIEFVDSHDVIKEMIKKHGKQFIPYPKGNRKAIIFKNVKEIKHADIYVASRQGHMVYCNRSAMELKRRCDKNVNGFANKLIKHREMAVNFIDIIAERNKLDIDKNFCARKLVGLLIDRSVESYQEIEHIAKIIAKRLAY